MKLFLAADSIAYTQNSQIGINPLSIKSIWLRKFNNTILATKAFEERMPFIHESCNQKVLDLYIQNLDKGLSEIDAMVVNLVDGHLKHKFAEFAKRGDGRVKISDKATKQLAKYYQTKLAAESMAIQRAKKDFWAKQDALDQDHQQRQNESQQRDIANQADVFVKEVKKNLCKVYEELDHPYDCHQPFRPRC